MSTFTDKRHFQRTLFYFVFLFSACFLLKWFAAVQVINIDDQGNVYNFGGRQAQYLLLSENAFHGRSLNSSFLHKTTLPPHGLHWLIGKTANLLPSSLSFDLRVCLISVLLHSMIVVVMAWFLRALGLGWWATALSVGMFVSTPAATTFALDPLSSALPVMAFAVIALHYYWAGRGVGWFVAAITALASLPFLTEQAIFLTMIVLIFCAEKTLRSNDRRRPLAGLIMVLAVGTSGFIFNGPQSTWLFVRKTVDQCMRWGRFPQNPSDILMETRALWSDEFAMFGGVRGLYAELGFTLIFAVMALLFLIGKRQSRRFLWVLACLSLGFLSIQYLVLSAALFIGLIAFWTTQSTSEGSNKLSSLAVKAFALIIILANLILLTQSGRLRFALLPEVQKKPLLFRSIDDLAVKIVVLKEPSRFQRCLILDPKLAPVIARKTQCQISVSPELTQGQNLEHYSKGLAALFTDQQKFMAYVQEQGFDLIIYSFQFLSDLPLDAAYIYGQNRPFKENDLIAQLHFFPSRVATLEHIWNNQMFRIYKVADPAKLRQPVSASVSYSTFFDPSYYRWDNDAIWSPGRSLFAAYRCEDLYDEFLRQPSPRSAAALEDPCHSGVRYLQASLELSRSRKDKANEAYYMKLLQERLQLRN